MAVERDRGISVPSAVMSFEHQGLAFNRLDTPGHEDFSESTYRTLTGVDSAGMVLDAATNGCQGGIEERTCKPLRGLAVAQCADHHLCQQARPQGRDPFDLLDEIEQSSALE